MEIRQLLQSIRAAMEQEFGARLKGLVLFGSFARGEQREDSDVDLLILLDGPISLDQDLGRIVVRVYPLTLEDPDHPIHPIPVDFLKYQRAQSPLYRIAQREGIAA